MLTKEAILAELKKRKRNYYKRMREIMQSRKENIKKWSEFKKNFPAGSYLVCEEMNLELQKRRLFIANKASGKISHCSHKHRCINFYINKFQIPSPTLRGVAKRPLILADMTFLTRLRSSEIPPLIVLAA